MNIFVAGASGATGRLLLQQLLEQGHDVRAVVRNAQSLPENLRQHPQLSLTEAGILDLGDDELARLVEDRDGIACCLGHNMTFKGIFGPPRRLVTDTVRRLCTAVQTAPSASPTRFVPMNTTGNRNRDLQERISLAEACVIGLVRLLVPPHADNEQAADYLRTKIGQSDPLIEWAAVRPDGLVNEEDVTDYDIHPSPTRSAIFDAGKVSRINVAHFMAALLTDDTLWRQWQGQMPVIYSRET